MSETTMFELTPGTELKVQPLFQELSFHVLIESVLQGHTVGRVFVNQPKEPTTALIWNTMDTLLLAGDRPDSFMKTRLNGLIRKKLLPMARARHVPFFNLYCGSAWRSEARDVLEGLPTEEVERKVYSARQTPPARIEIPEGWELQRITPELVDRQDLENANSLRGWIDSFWWTHGEFSERGIGYCVRDEARVLGWCLTVYVGPDRVELGAATDERHRGMGIASMTALATVKHALRDGLTPIWQCHADNYASNRVAERLGLTLEHRYSGYRASLAV